MTPVSGSSGFRTSCQRYAPLVIELVRTDLSIKYQRTVLGFAWSLITPFLTVLVLYLVFSGMFGRGPDFALYLVVGTVTWHYFASSTNSGLRSLVDKSYLVISYPIPPVLYIIGKTISGLVSSLLEFIIIIPLIFLLGGHISTYIFLFPVLHLLYMVIILGTSLILGSLFPFFRDLSEIWAVVLHLGMFLTPIFYPVSIIPESIRSLYLLNPVVSLMDSYRNLLLYNTPPAFSDILLIVGWAGFLLVCGYMVYLNMKDRFCEVLV